MKRLLHFTDLHLHDAPATVWRGVRPQQTFESSLYHARFHHWPADMIVLSGDLANEEFDDSYSRLATMAHGWQTPAVAVPGNHDDAQRMREAFENTPITFGGVHDVGSWRIVALDSQIPGDVPGRVSDDQREALRRACTDKSERHVIVTLHHPPLALGSKWLDGLRLQDDESFRALLSGLGVTACLFGHAHQTHDSIKSDVRYLGTPSTCIQFLPGSDEFAKDTRPPAYRWLELEDNGRLHTGIEWIDHEQIVHEKTGGPQ